MAITHPDYPSWRVEEASDITCCWSAPIKYKGVLVGYAEGEDYDENIPPSANCVSEHPEAIRKIEEFHRALLVKHEAEEDERYKQMRLMSYKRISEEAEAANKVLEVDAYVPPPKQEVSDKSEKAERRGYEEERSLVSLIIFVSLYLGLAGALLGAF